MSHAFLTNDEKTKFFYNPDMSGEVLIVTENDGKEVSIKLQNFYLKEYIAHIMRNNMIIEIEQMSDDEILKL